MYRSTLDAYQNQLSTFSLRPSATGATNVRQAPKGPLLQERPGVLPKLLLNRELSMEVVGNRIKLSKINKISEKHSNIKLVRTSQQPALQHLDVMVLGMVTLRYVMIRYVPDLGPRRACKHSPPLPVNPDSGNRSFPVIVCKWKTGPGPTGTASRPSGLELNSSNFRFKPQLEATMNAKTFYEVST